jgi:hypothetical protein
MSGVMKDDKFIKILRIWVAEWLRLLTTDHKPFSHDMGLCPNTHLKFKVSRHLANIRGLTGHCRLS